MMRVSALGAGAALFNEMNRPLRIYTVLTMELRASIVWILPLTNSRFCSLGIGAPAAGVCA